MAANWGKHVGRLPDGPVGIMADSHGSASAIAAALAIFDAGGCRRVIHLGDLCDSESPATANAAARTLMGAAVLTVMGNNERALLQSTTAQSGLEDGVRAFMAALPLQIEADGHLFVHNRPFPDRLGLSCLTGDFTAVDCRRIDRRFGGVLLFRGHSHLPSVCQTGSGAISADGLAGEKTILAPEGNWVVTCGALQDGWCMIWHPGRRTLAVCRL